jgi:rifampicin phosphotransferase
MNMKVLYLLSRHMLGASKQSVDHSIAGTDLDDVDVGPLMPLPRRALNTVRYFRSLFQVRRRLEEFVTPAPSYDIPLSPDAKAAYQNIQAALPLMYEAAAVHCHTSALSTALHGILFMLLSNGRPATAEHQATVSRLLAYVDPTHPDVEQSSLGLSRAIDRLTAAIAANPADANRFAVWSADKALAWLRDASDVATRQAFDGLLRDHGHRCAREGELREPNWGEDPRPLIKSVQGILASSGAGLPLRKREADSQLPSMPFVKRWVAKRLVVMTREAVVMRERSKSHAIRAMRAFRPAYLSLAALLVESKVLPDKDIIFFLTHEELGQLVDSSDPSLVRRALRRRRLHPRMMALKFRRSSMGKPVAIEEDQGADSAIDEMRGTPVSRGVVVGPARVARTVAEAELIEPGEILVVPSTDIGWAPYFLRAAGLASEIGGTISHGAVVARESGVPTIVNLPGITRRFRTGDKLQLDGDTGELRRLA